MPEENADTQKPVGPFEDFEGCVRHFEDDEQVDDPEALCGWMEENKEASPVQEYQPSEDEVQSLVEAMKEPAADTVLTDLEVTHVSGVGDPAQDSQWVMAKSAEDSPADWGVTSPLVFTKSHPPLPRFKAEIPEQYHAQDEDAAAEMAADLGCSGAHQHDDGTWMPCASHTTLVGTLVEAGELEVDSYHDEGESEGEDVEMQDPAEDLDDACWEGYVAVGLKPDPNGDGMVPDCVPEDSEQAQAASAKGCGCAGASTGTLALQDDQAQRKAWAPVLIPNETDKQGDVIPAEAIEKAAHEFLTEYRNIDTDHDLLEGKGVPVESWTLKEEATFTLPDGSESRPYPKGTWMMGVEFNDQTWDRVKNGDLTGFSIYGEATEHSVQELLGGGVGVEMGDTIAQFRATAKEADSDTTETMTDPENDPENSGNEQEAKDGEGGEQPDEGGEDQPTLKEIKDTVESTNESVESMQEKQADHAERLESLEAEVFEKDEGTEGEGDGEGGESEKDQPEVDADEVAEQATEQATEAATEEAKAEVKSLLGLDEDEDLPEDPQKRQEVVRKHLHESPEDDGLGSPDSWSEDEVSEVVK